MSKKPTAAEVDLFAKEARTNALMRWRSVDVLLIEGGYPSFIVEKAITVSRYRFAAANASAGILGTLPGQPNVPVYYLPYAGARILDFGNRITLQLPADHIIPDAAMFGLADQDHTLPSICTLAARLMVLKGGRVMRVFAKENDPICERESASLIEMMRATLSQHYLLDGDDLSEMDAIHQLLLKGDLQQTPIWSRQDLPLPKIHDWVIRLAATLPAPGSTLDLSRAEFLNRKLGAALQKRKEALAARPAVDKSYVNTQEEEAPTSTSFGFGAMKRRSFGT